MCLGIASCFWDLASTLGTRAKLCMFANQELG